MDKTQEKQEAEMIEDIAEQVAEVVPMDDADSGDFKIHYSIRSKLIAVVSILVIILMVSTAGFLLNQKKKELTRDIYVNSRSFAELTADDITSVYETYLAENGFIQFNRIIQSLFRKSEDVSRITLVRFNGEVLYDSETDKLQQYSGEMRSVSGDNQLLERVQAPFPSINVAGVGRIVYLEKDPLGQTFEVNLNGKKIEPIIDTDRVATIVHPVAQKYAVLYQVSYDQLDQRIAKTMRQIGLLLAGAIAFGVLLAIAIGAKIANPIRGLTAGAAEIAQGHFDYRVDIHSKDELGLLSNSFNQMARDLKESTKALIYKERVAKELEIAKEIQESIIPKNIPVIDGLDISASVEPAAEIGGDCYDFIKIDDTNTVIYLGDVTGHGVPAGLLVSVANALIYAFRSLGNIFDILVNVNAILQAKSQPNMFITMAMLNWNQALQKMEYISAGHEKILHYNAASSQVTELDSGGIALGMIPDCSKLLKKTPINMVAGDMIVLYSDGIPEAWGAKKQQYGMGRFRRVLLDAVKGHAQVVGTAVTAQTIREDILKDLHEFMGATPQADDITIMVIKKL
ncbi:MAG: SpoIIE family protein phosphatase [Candidatus Peregrinibacteria bacterium]|nr:SpoIIE family protein phosphatase [Candidatus Peregrinibacteria bacterium]MDZ4245355.1 SpoIIE family protein phosphatase [Candidatus Gracilibacteria bacterium]